MNDESWFLTHNKKFLIPVVTDCNNGGGASMSREGDKGSGMVMRMGYTACASSSQRTLPLLLLLLLPSRS